MTARLFSHSTTDVYPKALAKGERIAVHGDRILVRTFNIATLPRHQPRAFGGTAPGFTAGSDCIISDRAEVAQSVLWDNVVVAPDALVNRAVLGDGVRIHDGEVIANSIVVRKSLVDGKTAHQKLSMERCRATTLSCL